MKLKPIVTARTYTIPLEPKDFEHLEQFDVGEDLEVDLSHQLADCNAYNVDFNGHFGANIFLSIESDDDTPATWENIKTTIKDYVRRSHQWANAEKVLELCSHHHKHHKQFYLLLDNKYMSSKYEPLPLSTIRAFIISHAAEFELEIDNVSWEHITEGINATFINT